MSYLKRIISLLIVFVFMITPLTVNADEKPYKKYGYDENFEYGDEYIAHALKSSVPKIFLYYEATIEYSPLVFDLETFRTDLINTYSQYYRYYSKDEILAYFLETAQGNIAKYLTFAQPKTVETEGCAVGSGVVISEDGYIATNAHVASVDDANRVEFYLSGLQEEVLNDIVNINTELQEYGLSLNLSDDELLKFYDIVLSNAAEYANVLDENIRMEVWFPPADGSTDSDSAIIYEADVVEIGTQDGIEGFTQDTAILKIDAENLVAMKLSDTLPETNSKIVSAGFPVASDALFTQNGSSASVLSMTVGTGQVARLVPIDNSDYSAIEINTTISGGNSGGPSVDSKLNIEGLNTYNLVSDNRYAYMISAEFVRELSEDFDIEQGEITYTFLAGLQLLQQGYGPAAKKCFERVAEINDDIPYIEKLIALSEEAPDNEHPADKKEEKNNSKIVWIIAGSTFVALLIIIILIIIVAKSGKKKKAKTDSTNYNMPPV